LKPDGSNGADSAITKLRDLPEGLSASLFLSQVADKRQLEALAL
jgi:hypothetical protein